MRRPKMSTGAWIFTGLVCAAVIAPVSVYAATVTNVRLLGASGTVAGVTSQRQILTTQIAPSHVIHAAKNVNGPCTVVYTPPAGKGIVVTSVVYNYGSGVQGNENFGGLFNPGCSGSNSIVDQIDQVDKYGSIQHLFPTGLPMKGVSATSAGGTISVFITGYLVAASDLP